MSNINASGSHQHFDGECYAGTELADHPGPLHKVDGGQKTKLSQRLLSGESSSTENSGGQKILGSQKLLAPKNIRDLRADNRERQRLRRRRRGQLTWAEYVRRKREVAAIRRAAKDAERAERKEKRRLKTLATRAAYREKGRQRSKAWRLAHKDRMRELLRAWKKANPEKRRRHRNSAESNKRRRKYLRELQGGKCAICAQKLGADVHIDHIVPLAAGGSNRRSNLQLVHPACNYAKRDHDPIDFSRSLGRLL